MHPNRAFEWGDIEPMLSFVSDTAFDLVAAIEELTGQI